MTERVLQGYQKKPLAITLFTLIFLLMPAGVLLHLFILSGNSFSVLGQIVRSSYFLTEWAFAWAAAAAVFVVSRWSFACFVLLSGYVLFIKISHVITHPNLETPARLLLTALWLGISLYVLSSSLKTPYLNPKLRWWLRPSRIGCCKGATLQVQGVGVPVTVLNLSKAGVFVKAAEPQQATPLLPQRLGEQCELAIELSESERPKAESVWLNTSVELVWKGKADSPFWGGMGLKFRSLSKSQRQQLRRFLRYEA